MSDKYILKGHVAVPANTEEWARFFENIDNRRVASTNFGEDIRVSTVFLGLDYRFGNDGPPLIFETMIFGGDFDDWQKRCSTWEEAETLHAEACKLVTDTLASIA